MHSEDFRAASELPSLSGRLLMNGNDSAVQESIIVAAAAAAMRDFEIRTDFDCNDCNFALLHQIARS